MTKIKTSLNIFLRIIEHNNRFPDYRLFYRLWFLFTFTNIIKIFMHLVNLSMETPCMLILVTCCIITVNQSYSGPAKWISKWRGHGTLKRNVGHHGWLTRKFFLNSRLSSMAKAVIFWPWWQPFNSFCWNFFFFSFFFSIFFLLRKKSVAMVLPALLLLALTILNIHHQLQNKLCSIVHYWTCQLF